MTDFYDVTAPSSQSWLWVMLESLPTRDGSITREDGLDRFSEVARAVERGDTSILTGPPVYHPYNYGKLRGDLLWTGGGPPLASERFVEALRRGDVTGWSTYEVDVRYRRGDRPVPGYVGFVVAGRTGRWFDDHVPWQVVDEDRGLPHTIGCDPSPGWDGHGVFTEEGRTGMSFWMSAPAVQRLRDAGATGVELVPAEQHEHLHGVPGLPEWPED